ncbi:chemokine (C-X-C motif) ligand 18a, duplicate 1 [Lepisosteus oculatus]|uniref:chemokine (C-X-C motif) ligand 18a, duplicate 1 n=1 Tax=Lepisosteus oculatus TaxID=7918 RepID=UPI0007402EFC|nr:PREDICTED: C-X-C motif chemokine 2-like [Lepisosteus oculatus]
MFFKVTTLNMLAFLCCGRLTDQKAEATSLRERCECIRTIESFPLKKMSNFTIAEKSSQCKNVQIILHLKNNSDVCLNPDSTQGRRLHKCWKKNGKSTTRHNRCLRLRARKGRKGKKEQ